MAEADASSSYPLNCIDDTGDGFSGWFAISHPRQCNDFCYWDLPANAWNTANPHRTTAIDTNNGTVYWTCIYDSAGDSLLVSDAVGERWVDSYARYAPHLAVKGDGANNSNVKFPFLRCQKGAGERLKTRAGEAVKSAAFWEGWIAVASLILVAELALFYFYRRRRRKVARYDQVGSDSEGMEGDNNSHEEGQLTSLYIDGEEIGGEEYGGERMESENELTYGQLSFLQQWADVTPRCKYCAPLASMFICRANTQQWIYVARMLLLLVLNLLLAFTVSFSSISLMEIHGNPHFKEGMERLTPACSDPSLVCPAGNRDIERGSSRWLPVEGGHGMPTRTEKSSAEPNAGTETTAAMRPFSYIMASDAQLYWFNGEFAEMGAQAIPSSCSPSDSCGRCTGKHGLSTNTRLKKAWESLMTGKTHGLNATDDDLPVPNTLIMNGDLTAYFHPYEKRAYNSIYDNIEGLEHYFPSLGNHDIEHHGGAMYGGDEWVGVPNCNIEHAIGYFKSGFCGEIPHFNTSRIVRYDSSSLAYSWDEGRYHFVHSHYYPSYEMASQEYHSSLEWLERDLHLANDAGLATILFVHAAQGLNPAMEDVILGKNIKAILAGHTHRCLHRRCEGIYPLNEEQLSNIDSLGLTAEKCIPAAYDTCEVLNGENLVYARQMEASVPFPEKRLHNEERKDKPLCPKRAPFYINETDNSLLCRRVTYSEPSFPSGGDSDLKEAIPIFWSGSSSFETFLRGDFFTDRFVINAMALASDEGDAARYADLHTVPNAAYPYHEPSDLEETVIYL
ncbi:hypothetical protein ACHAXT_012614 [Thalassiosira profunda]